MKKFQNQILRQPRQSSAHVPTQRIFIPTRQRPIKSFLSAVWCVPFPNQTCIEMPILIFNQKLNFYEC